MAQSRVFLLAVALGLLFWGASTPAALGQDRISLFNGKNLEGWKKHGEERWYVEDGLLVCESGPQEEYGYLSTRPPADDYVLRLEFKQVSNGNSGVFFRSSLEGTKISGWQAEVAPPGGDTGGIYESYGRGWLAKVPEEKEDVLQMGAWNTLRVRVHEDSAATWLNGTQMVALSDTKIGKAEGRIALQIHSGGGIKVLWRDITLEPIE